MCQIEVAGFVRAAARVEGLGWFDRPGADSATAVPAVSLPDELPEHDAALAVKSLDSGDSFRITSQEIKYYGRMQVPLPRLAYDERMNQRLLRLGDISLIDRTCDKSKRPVNSAYAPAEVPIIWEKSLYDDEFQ